MTTTLPIHAHQEDIVRLAREHQVIVVVGETGSGKTTVVPHLLYEHGFCRKGAIAVTEPRRIAAVSVATYVAKLHGGEVGGLIGYRIRHQNRTKTDVTKIAYMTEGVVLRELLKDRLLRRYDVLILDEVHERNLFQDVLMALVKRLLPKRPDLTVIVMSATINEEKFSAYFDGAPVVHVEGRSFPVTVEYVDGADNDHERSSVDAVKRLLAASPTGDVLVFQPDYASIRTVTALLQEQTSGVNILPLYGNQSPDEQYAVVNGRTGRNVIVSTNIAETSVTIDGVTAVVDTGLVKEMRYDPRRSTSSLQLTDHSKAGCDQRMGRAGRTAPGHCVRLYGERSYERRHRFSQPELLRSNLDNVYLTLRAMGFSDRDVRELPYMHPPDGSYWANARETLTVLGALDKGGEVTELGLSLADIPLPPVIGKMVLAAERYKCVRAVVTIAATFSTRPLFTRPIDEMGARLADGMHRHFRNADSDFLTARNAVERWRKAENREAFAKQYFLHPVALEEIEATEQQIEAILEEAGIELTEGGDAESIKKAVSCGLVANLLQNEEGNATYSKKRCEGIFIHPGSVLWDKKPPPKYIVTSEVVKTTRTYARMAQVVPTRWLGEVFDIDGFKHREKKKDVKKKQRFRNDRKGRQRDNGRRR